jgi:hypothetical protein
LQDEMNRWNFGQNVDRQKLADFMNMVQGNYGGQSSSTQTGAQSYRNRWAGALGGGMSGAAAGSAFGPYGTAAGGLLGALGGWF